MTLKINRAPLLSTIKLYASFYHIMWIQTGVTVRKRLSWVMTSVTLTFDLWPWPFAWTSLLSLKILWRYDDRNIVKKVWQTETDRQTDRQTDGRTDGRTDTDKQTDRQTWPTGAPFTDIHYLRSGHRHLIAGIVLFGPTIRSLGMDT